MANDITSERLWICDTAGVLAAVGTPIIVRKIVYFPALASDDVLIQEYNSLGVLRSAIVLKAGPSDASGVTLDFGENGRELNGFKLATIDGGTLHVYIGRN